MREQAQVSSGTRIILIRHPQTQANVQGGSARMAGGFTDSALTATGREQVALLARRMGDEPAAAAVYSSPLPRAVQLSAALAAQAQVAISLRPGLREIDCGRLDGLPIPEIKQRYPAEWEANLRQSDPDFRWPGGESYREFRQRCLSEMQAMSEAHPEDRVLVVTHAGFISQVVGFILGISAAQWESFRPGNTSLTEIHWSRAQPALVGFDDRTHLNPPLIGRRAAG